MISINRQKVDLLSKQLNSKTSNGLSDPALYPIFSHAHTNSSDHLKELSTYEMAHWINYNDRWLSNRNSPHNTISYKRGTILYLELGAENFGHEPSFTHPGIVLAQNKFSILIVPCSSKKFGKGFPEIIDATPGDGFTTNTGIQTNCIRWISKNRVVSIIGTTTSEILDKIDVLLLKTIPSHGKMILSKDNIIETLQKENEQLKSSLATCNQNIQESN